MLVNIKFLVNTQEMRAIIIITISIIILIFPYER